MLELPHRGNIQARTSGTCSGPSARCAANEPLQVAPGGSGFNRRSRGPLTARPTRPKRREVSNLYPLRSSRNVTKERRRGSGAKEKGGQKTLAALLICAQSQLLMRSADSSS